MPSRAAVRKPAKKVVVGKGPGWPWSPVTDIEDADVFALKALAKGNASSGQQIRALDFIRGKICEGRRLSFMPGGEDGRRATDFAEGKRFVDIQIQRFLNMEAQSFNSRGAPPAMPGPTSETKS